MTAPEGRRGLNPTPLPLKTSPRWWPGAGPRDFVRANGDAGSMLRNTDRQGLWVKELNQQLDSAASRRAFTTRQLRLHRPVSVCALLQRLRGRGHASTLWRTAMDTGRAPASGLEGGFRAGGGLQRWGFQGRPPPPALARAWPQRDEAADDPLTAGLCRGQRLPRGAGG